MVEGVRTVEREDNRESEGTEGNGWSERKQRIARGISKAEECRVSVT